jgi:tape measure domain-containing protein
MTEEIHKIVIVGDDSSARRVFRNIREGSNRARQDLDRISNSTDSVGVSLRNAVRAGAAFAGISIGANLVRDVSNLADSWKLIDGRIRNATSSQSAYQEASRELLKIATATNSEYEAVSTFFARTNKFIEENGGNQRDTLNLVTLVSQAAKVSGAGVQEQSSAIRQLSQALASGVLRGDEFNSVMENAPRLAQALADGLNVPIGSLRKMAEEGQLTADIVTKALLGQADKIAGEFAKIPLTTRAAVTNLATAFGDYINKSDAANAATSSLATSINDLARNLPGLLTSIEQLIALGLPVYMIKLAGSIDLVSVAFTRLLPAAITVASLAKVLELLTAINNERLRQRELQQQEKADRAQLVATEHLLNVQRVTIENYRDLSEVSRNLYRQELEQALAVAELKRKLAAEDLRRAEEKGVEDPLTGYRRADPEKTKILKAEAETAAKRAREIRTALIEIAQADGDRARAMKLHSDNVIAAKNLELARLQSVFAAQKAGLQAAEKAFEDARQKRKDVVKEFQDIQKELTAQPQGEVKQFQLEKAVEDARRAQEAAAAAPASEADKLATQAIEKARNAAELLRAYKEQQSQTGSSIDEAAAKELVQRLSDQLKGIAGAAAGVQEKIAADQIKTMQEAIQNTLNQAEALKNMQVGFDEAAAAKDFDALIALIREKAQNTPIKVPVQIVSGSLPDKLLSGENTGVRDSSGNIVYREGFARGGAVRGPGTATSDNIIARLSPGEHVFTAREVMAAGGHSAIYRLRRALLDGKLPKFANGGAVMRASASIPSIASTSVGSSAGGLDRGVFILPNGDPIEVQAESSVFDRLTSLSLQHRKRR